MTATNRHSTLLATLLVLACGDPDGPAAPDSGPGDSPGVGDTDADDASTGAASDASTGTSTGASTDGDSAQSGAGASDSQTSGAPDPSGGAPPPGGTTDKPACALVGEPCDADADCCTSECVAGACEAPDDCTPQTCDSLGRECGTWQDGCGGAVHCGSCGPNETCEQGSCVCTPKTCGELGKDCGSWPDGCGGAVHCGGCPENYDCSAGVCELACAAKTFILENEAPNFSIYSVACDLVLQEFSYMYLCDPEDDVCSGAIPWGGWAAHEMPLGDVDTIDAWCCYSDGTTCFGQDMTCPVNGKNFPCSCVQGQVKLIADTCPTEYVVVCQ